MNFTPNITTVVVTFNGLKWIERCLNSLIESAIYTKIVIVDNASTDGTSAFIKKKYPKIILLQQIENLGFGKANNVGISFALKNKADYVFLLNQDAKIESTTVETLVRISSLNPNYGILSPMQYNWKGDKLEYYFRQFMMRNNDLYVAHTTKNKKEEIYEIPFVNAAAWLIPSKTFETVGGFDPIFHHYGEDNNYCQRVNFHYLKVGIVPFAKIYHDSTDRRGIEIPLFSNQYFSNEIKQLQIKYADVNTTFSVNYKTQIRKHNLKIIARNLLIFNLKNVLGYFKKYQIFEQEIVKIQKSRRINVIKGTHYL